MTWLGARLKNSQSPPHPLEQLPWSGSPLGLGSASLASTKNSPESNT